MTDPNYTHITIVVDRSGSMAAIRSEAEMGLRTFLAEQVAFPGGLTTSLYQFDAVFEEVWSFSYATTQAADCWKLEPRGTTALLDAVGRAVIDTGARLAAMAEHERPGKVIVMIVTDGAENASQEWTLPKVKELLERHRSDFAWQVLFLAANVDAFATGAGMGVGRGQTISYAATDVGTRQVYAAATRSTTDYRAGRTFSVDLPDDAAVS